MERIFNALNIESKSVDDEVDKRNDQDNKIMICISLNEVFLEILVSYLEPSTQNASH